MPTIEPFDLPGARIADHWIRRRPPPRAAAGSFREHEAPGGDWAVFRYREQDPLRWSVAELTALRAMAIVQQGHAAEAAPLFEEWDRSPAAQSGALARLPMLALLRGVALASTGDPRGAATAYRRALLLDPEFVEAQLNLATALVEAGDSEAALAEVEPLLRNHPQADAPWLVAAAAHAEANRQAEALVQLQKSLAAFSAQPLALQRLGRAAAAAGETALARRALLGAWSLDPRLPGLAAEVRTILQAP
jgi:tetratricopeptide (TPR) repeat protein